MNGQSGRHEGRQPIYAGSRKPRAQGHQEHCDLRGDEPAPIGCCARLLTVGHRMAGFCRSTHCTVCLPASAACRCPSIAKRIILGRWSAEAPAPDQHGERSLQLTVEVDFIPGRRVQSLGGARATDDLLPDSVAVLKLGNRPLVPLRPIAGVSRPLTPRRTDCHSSPCDRTRQARTISCRPPCAEVRSAPMHEPASRDWRCG
jgi:hypothetical protein